MNIPHRNHFQSSPIPNKACFFFFYAGQTNPVTSLSEMPWGQQPRRDTPTFTMIFTFIISSQAFPDAALPSWFIRVLGTSTAHWRPRALLKALYVSALQAWSLPGVCGIFRYHHMDVYM